MSTTVFLAPIYNGTAQPTTGWLPLAGGFIYTYLSETTTPHATWTTEDGDVENANPIELGVDGRPPHQIWLETGIAYTFVLTDSLLNVIETQDNLSGVNDVSATTATIAVQDEGVAQGNASTFNFVGGSVTAGVSGSVATITVTAATGTLVSGDIIPSAALTRSGALICDGSAVSRTTYSTLFAAIVPSKGTFTVTVATPAVFSNTGHGLTAGDKVYFTTTGALPTGLSVNTIYYVIAAGLTANAFEVSATSGGSAINTTGTQSGVHTLRFCPYGLGNGTTTFNVPDIRGQALIGSGTGSGLTARQLGVTGGSETVTLTGAQSGTSAHTHTGSTTGSGTLTTRFGILQGGSTRVCASDDNVGDLSVAATLTGTSVTVNASSEAVASTAHTNMQPFNVVNWFIITG